MKIAHNTVKVLLSVIFLAEGLMKLFTTNFMVNNFIHWGYPFWFMYAIGAFEVIFSIMLWGKRSEKVATLGFFILMIGAFSTHIRSHDPLQYMTLAIVATVLLVALVILQRRK